VGSIPASLIIFRPVPVLHTQGPYKKKNLFYKMKFNSLVPISSNLKFDSIYLFKSIINKKDSTRLFSKRSYILISWVVFFIKFNCSVQKKKTKPTSITFYILPKTTSKFTITKAPMAHKTFSQEQYLFSKSSLVIRFKVGVVKNLKFNQILYLLLVFQYSHFYFETNIFFIVSIKLRLPFSDSNTFRLENY
jgi:hypothetical protein